MTFFGDDTWTRLFPGKFLRQDPVTSFFVSDYTEVDHNVTRHLGSEMKRDDWDVMILHYLGLDHIGHLEGPGSSLVQPKLDQMGDIIKTVWDQLQSKNREGQPPLMMANACLYDALCAAPWQNRTRCSWRSRVEGLRLGRVSL